MACELCGKRTVIMMAMAEGTGTPWELCTRCWLEALHFNDAKLVKVEVLEPGTPMGKSLLEPGTTYVATDKVMNFRGDGSPPTVREAKSKPKTKRATNRL